MPIVLLVFVIISIAAIIFLSRHTFVQSKDKNQFLKELARQVQGKLEAIEGQENSYRVTFHFEGYDLIFEDIELTGFQEKITKGYLRLKMKNRFTLIFTELERSGGVRADTFMPTKINEASLTQMMKVYLPKNLSDMIVKTNDPYISNKLFEDPKVLPIFTKYRNVDTRGYPSMSLRIVDGIIVLEFSTAAGVNPNLNNLRTNIGSFENYIDEIILIAKKLAKIGYS
jgi:hypothetical protein